jgi:hypothetical protein
MRSETPNSIDPTIFVAVFRDNWENARHIKSERISFMNAYSLIAAGVLAFLENVRTSELMRIAVLFFMVLFSGIGLLISLRLKAELEECLAKIEAMSAQANMVEFVAHGQLQGKSSRYPRFRWMFPIFYSMTMVGFVALIVYTLVIGEPVH